MFAPKIIIIIKKCSGCQKSDENFKLLNSIDEIEMDDNKDPIILGNYMSCFKCANIYHNSCVLEGDGKSTPGGNWVCNNCIKVELKEAIKTYFN